MVTNETGIIEEEYRASYVADRVDTTATVWLGLTVGCARCHDHKYDPITQREYYQLFAAFNNIDETGIIKDVAPLSPAPAVMLPTPEQDAELAKLGAERKAADARQRAQRPALEKAVEAWEPTALAALAAHADPRRAGPLRFRRRAAGERDGERYAQGNARSEGTRGRVRCDAIHRVPAAAAAGAGSRLHALAVDHARAARRRGAWCRRWIRTPTARGFEILWYKSQPRIKLAHRYGTDGLEVVAEQKLSRQAVAALGGDL